MKTGRRQDPDGLRRISRDRDVTMNRVRKRPSMLLEFQGKHYNHRETNRERFYRYDTHESSQGMKNIKRDRYAPGVFKNEVMSDSRLSSGSLYPHTRSLPPHHHTTYTSFQDESVVPMEIVNNNHGDEGGIPTKRPRLLEQLGGSRSRAVSGPVPLVEPAARRKSSLCMPSSPPQGLGLSAYLEDIESDEEGDLLMVDEEDKPPPPPPPRPRPPLAPTMPPPSHPSSAAGSGGGSQLSKEQLLMKMEAVDRDIAATESQITSLQKRQTELEEGAAVQSTPSPLQPSLSSSSTSSSTAEVRSEDGVEEEGVASFSVVGQRQGSPKRSLQESVYSENKLKARCAHASLSHLSSSSSSISPPAALPLYSQPWEAPGYYDVITRHQHFRPELVHLIQKQQRQKHDMEVALCERYDACVMDWKKRLDRIENSSKRKARDLRNRELFERTFPELKVRREQQERLMRVDQRGYGIVRSDLEFNQVMCELIEQEEAPARSRRTHALIPAMMVVGGQEERMAFHSTNSLVQDPMALYRAAKITNIWTDHEKAVFREKYALCPKNFEAISSFLPCKTTGECVRYYYLSKKNEKFKQVARKTAFKRRKFIKPSELIGLTPHTPARLVVEPKMRSPLLSEVVTPRTPPAVATPTMTTPTTPNQEEVATKVEPATPKSSRYGDWTDEDIDNLRTGLRNWGRAWSKIYREVARRKTATQCKRFFEDFCHDENLRLTQALSERSSIQNAEKAQRRAASRKLAPSSTPLARKRLAAKTAKTQQQRVEPESEGERGMEGREGESEAMESASNGDTAASGDDDSGSESTITDSSPEDNVTLPSGSTHSSVRRSWKSRGSSPSPSHSGQTASDKGAFDIFISAAEALSNIVPPEVALHDHNYALAPLNSVELQGSSGLSLIAAAAAVVSPTLSRTAGSGKFPAVSPVRAPRGRPPNTQRRGSGGSSCKLSPTLLSPAGSSIYVPLTDTTKSSFRSRTKSAPSDRPRLQLSRAGPSNLRYSISSKPSSPRPILPPASYTRTKDPPGTASSPGGTPSLKSMIASCPQSSNNSSNAAFETLVNVAVAASPAELPKTTPTQQQQPPTLSISFQSPMTSAPSTSATPTSGTPLSDGMYSIDMSQAINILTLAHLTQAPVSTSMAPGSRSSSSSSVPHQLLLTPSTQTSSGILGAIVSQNSHVGGGGLLEGGGGKPANPASVNVLIGHLTSGSATPSPTTPSELSVNSRSSTGVHSDPRHHPKLPSRQSRSPAQATPTATPTTSGEDLSNLNLLSTLVAAVAGSQAPPPSSPSSPSSSSTYTSITHTTRPDIGSPSLAKNTVSSINPPLSLSSSSSSSGARSSAFKATNLPTPLASSSAKSKDMPSRTKIYEKSSQNLVNSEHYRSSSTQRTVTANNSSPLDNLARSVVRSSSLTQSSLSPANSSSPHTHPPLPTYPSPAPSISQQSTLLLYTRSLSLPNAAGAVDFSSEEEDHLESATRGISELSKLLGTDTGSGDPLGGNGKPSATTTTTPASSYRNSWGDQPTPVRTSRTPRSGGGVGFSTKAELGNDSTKFLSGLLESHTNPSLKTSTSTDVTSNSQHNLSSR